MYFHDFMITRNSTTLQTYRKSKTITQTNSTINGKQLPMTYKWEIKR